MPEFAFDPSQPCGTLACRVHQFKGCQDASCAPPPAGTGGSRPGGGVGDGVPRSSTRATVDDHAPLISAVLGGTPVSVHAHDVDDVVAGFATHDGPVDLTLLSVESLPSLFSAMRGNGVPRAEMPQIPSERLNEFQDRLAADGINFQRDTADPATLKATQSELDGRKVGGMMLSMRDGSFRLDGDPLWVSSDGHILDGHHRWAAAAAISADCGGCVKIPVVSVDVPMADLLAYANAFNDEVGVQRKAFGEPDRKKTFATESRDYFTMATDTDDDVDDADLVGLPHGDGSAFERPKGREFRLAAVHRPRPTRRVFAASNLPPGRP